MKQRILFVSHCILNTAAKVARAESAGKKEESVRNQFLTQIIEKNIQLVQLPCPEFTLYGPSRWGHTKEQFDNPFFRNHCKDILKPVILQMKAYLNPAEAEKFEVLGIVGVDGSPSCGIASTCSGNWGGEFSGRTDLAETLATCHRALGMGVFMDVLFEMMEAEGITLPCSCLNNPGLAEFMDQIPSL